MIFDAFALDSFLFLRYASKLGMVLFNRLDTKFVFTPHQQAESSSTFTCYP